MGGNLREKLEEAPTIKFHGFKFHGTIDCGLCSENFELGSRGMRKMERFSVESYMGS